MSFSVAYDTCVFPTPHSWKVMTKISKGTRVTVAGAPKSCDGDVMVPIQPKALGLPASDLAKKLKMVENAWISNGFRLISSRNL